MDETEVQSKCIRPFKGRPCCRFLTLYLLGKLQPCTVTRPSSFCMWAFTCLYWALFCSLRDGEMHKSFLQTEQRSADAQYCIRSFGKENNTIQWRNHCFKRRKQPFETCVRNPLFIEEVKSLGLLCWELGKGAAPLHQAAWGVVLDVGLRVCLLHRRYAGGGAKESAEAAGGKVRESQRENRVEGKREAGEGQRPTRGTMINTTVT